MGGDTWNRCCPQLTADSFRAASVFVGLEDLEAERGVKWAGGAAWVGVRRCTVRGGGRHGRAGERSRCQCRDSPGGDHDQRGTVHKYGGPSPCSFVPIFTPPYAAARTEPLPAGCRSRRP